ncbi:MAG: response regulator transcription factor [Opitutales bacterium]|nr:response regulator transcription factor [Opitutales bacterium]
MILVVEDDRTLSESLCKGLSEAGYSCRTVHSRKEAADAMELLPDLIILDLGLPDGDGIAVLKMVRNRSAELPVIITTARSELSSRLKGLSSGADDYMVKPYSFDELLARIRIQLRHFERTQTRWEIGDLVIDLPSRTASRSGQVLDLTPREFDLLAYMASLHGEVATRQMLQESIWKVRSNMTSMDNVIDVHASRLRQKLGEFGGVPLLHTVRGVGLVLKEGK